jgi:hypothetical protein
MNNTSDRITEEVMLALADSMAAAATCFSAHGYDQFILARELFISTNRILFSAPPVVPICILGDPL